MPYLQHPTASLPIIHTHTAQDELVGIAYSRWTTAGAMATRTVMEGRHSDLMSGIGANECILTEDTYGQYVMQVSGRGSVYISCYSYYK